MKFITRLVFASVVASSLVACGGGGTSGTAAAPAVSIDTYPLRQAWVNFVTGSQTRAFTISGTVQGAAVTGSGSTTVGALQAATFEGAVALGKTTIVTGTISAAGQTIPYGSSSTSYFSPSPTYLALGYASSAEYAVVKSQEVIPLTARVNDTGVIYTYTRYGSSNKTGILGTTTVSYAIQPDSPSTALLKVISTDIAYYGSAQSTSILTFRMTPTGDLTKLTEESQQGTTALTLKY
jgi:hypothetical protein